METKQGLYTEEELLELDAESAPPASDPASDGIEADGTVNGDWLLFWSGDN